MPNFKFYNIGKANAEITSAEDALAPALAKAGIHTLSVDGKTVPVADAPLANRIAALLAANPPGENLQQASELLVSNDIISRRCEKSESDLAIAQTSVATLTRENADLTGKLATAQTSVATLTAEKGDLNNRIAAAVNQFSANDKELQQHNTALSKVCISAGCLDLRGEDGKPLRQDASAEQKLAAANAIPFDEKLTAYQGAVNGAIARTGVEVAALPAAGNGPRLSLSSKAILNQYNAINDPTEKMDFYRKNKPAIDAAYREGSNN